MVSELAKQAVNIKCGFENAKMTGNYECAYALGIISKAAGIEKNTEFNNLIELRRSMDDKLKGIDIQDDKIKKLIQMLSDYETTEVFDEQMRELYNDGYSDKSINLMVK